MRKRGTCNVEGCEQPRVTGAILCTDHLGEKRRCEGMVRETDPDTGEVLSERRCKRAAMPGLLRCTSHGGSGPTMKAVSDRTPALTAMQRYVVPYDGDLDGVTGFELEYRRTYGRIIWLEQQIAGLEDEQALIFGLAKEEHVNATEFPGTNKVYEARINGFELLLQWERKHFLELTKTMLRANLDERKLNMLKGQIDYTFTLVMKTAAILGHDVSDPAVRLLIGSLFENEKRDIAAIAAKEGV